MSRSYFFQNDDALAPIIYGVDVVLWKSEDLVDKHNLKRIGLDGSDGVAIQVKRLNILSFYQV